MIKLKVINGGKPQGPICALTVRLFSAHSLVDNFEGCDGVKLRWLCVEREAPVVPYGRLIAGYKDIDRRVRPYFEQYMDELFTEEEIQSLETHLLQNRGWALYTHEEPVPASDVFVPMPFREIKQGEGRGFFTLPEEESARLPFKICAYYDLRECLPSLLIRKEARDLGVLYLEETFRHLGIEESQCDASLRAAVEALYDRHGLYVVQGKPIEERTRERERFAAPSSSDARPPRE